VTSSIPLRLRCREIGAGDIDGIATLLDRGFPERGRAYWKCVLERISEHPPPPGFPKYGYLLEASGTPVGAILVIFSAMTADGKVTIRGNVSSWYVEAAFRSHATFLTQRALAHHNVTFLNISPAPNTWPILEAQGYTRYSTGQFICVPALHAICSGARITTVTRDTHAGADLSSSEVELLLAHANYGCISVICTYANRRHPFVFLRGWHRWKFAPLPYALLAYCRDLADFIRFAGPLGRFLALRGMPLVFIDSNGRIPGLIGKFSDMGPKFFRGPHPVRLGDLSYTERVMFNDLPDASRTYFLGRRRR
jgi:hypothetical protein